MFGKDCTESCGKCVNNDKCHLVNGSCVNGCNPGYYGINCTNGTDNLSQQLYFFTSFVHLNLPLLFYLTPEKKKKYNKDIIRKDPNKRTIVNYSLL